MELQEFFDPIIFSNLESENVPNTYAQLFKIFTNDAPFPDIDEMDIVIFGVPEERKAVGNEGCKDAADAIRGKLHELFCGDYSVRIADIGNLILGETIEDTYIAVAEVCSMLMKRGILPIILGGSQDISYAQYKSYKALGQMINMVSVDSRFDLGTSNEELNSKSYLGKIITDEPNFLFNFSNLGYQSYYIGGEAVQLMKKLYFDVYRIGHLRSDFEEAEPVIRSADMMSFDVSSIRHSDAPGNGQCSPNGFYGEEACRITRYAGLSEKLTSIGFYEVNPKFDNRDQTSSLVAQMIWYFIDGFYHRKGDDPANDLENFVKYKVHVKSLEKELLFYKSTKTDRWWMEVPQSQKKLKQSQYSYIPCSFIDYQSAINDLIPDRWWQSYHKFN